MHINPSLDVVIGPTAKGNTKHHKVHFLEHPACISIFCPIHLGNLLRIDNCDAGPFGGTLF